MCGLHVSFWSSIRPRYYASFLIGSYVSFIVTTGQSVFRFVNVTCADLVSLTHFCVECNERHWDLAFKCCSMLPCDVTSPVVHV